VARSLSDGRSGRKPEGSGVAAEGCVAAAAGSAPAFCESKSFNGTQVCAASLQAQSSGNAKPSANILSTSCSV